MCRWIAFLMILTVSLAHADDNAAALLKRTLQGKAVGRCSAEVSVKEDAVWISLTKADGKISYISIDTKSLIGLTIQRSQSAPLLIEMVEYSTRLNGPNDNFPNTPQTIRLTVHTDAAGTPIDLKFERRGQTYTHPWDMDWAPGALLEGVNCGLAGD